MSALSRLEEHDNFLLMIAYVGPISPGSPLSVIGYRDKLNETVLASSRPISAIFTEWHGQKQRP